MTPLLAVPLVIVAGLPLAYALVRNALLAILIAPLVTAMLATLAILLMLIVGGPLNVWLAVVFLGQFALTVLLLRRHQAPLPHGGWAEARWLVLPLLPPLLLVLSPPSNWDANSIWWTHAAYFTKGAEYARAAIASPTYIYSHTDYPPLASAPVAAAWSILPGYSLWVAQFVSTTIALSAIATLAYCVRYLTGRYVNALPSRLAAIAVGLSVWATSPFAVASGLGDPIWAAPLAGAAILLLIGTEPLTRPALPLLLMTAAILTKNEGLVATGLLAVLVTLRERRNPRRAWLVWLPVAAGLAWTALSRHLGAYSDVTGPARIHGLLTADPAVLARIRPTAVAVWHTSGPVIVVALAVTVLGCVSLRTRRQRLGLGSDLWLWLLLAGYVASLTLTYVLSTNDIAWYLATSIDRVTIVLPVLACASSILWAVCAIAPARRPPHAEPVAPPPPAHQPLEPAPPPQDGTGQPAALFPPLDSATAGYR